MVTQSRPLTPGRHADGQSRAAVQFFGMASGVLLFAAIVATLLFFLIGRPSGPAGLFPPAFWFSSGLLAAGSITLARAVQSVRLERQRLFRRWLVTSVLLGALFMGVQSYGLAWMMPQDRTALAASTGVTAFVLMLAALHAMHFIVATLFLSLVTVRAFADRYDHEYYWGVSVCAWFWHVLGIVWAAILAVFAIAA